MRGHGCRLLQPLLQLAADGHFPRRHRRRLFSASGRTAFVLLTLIFYRRSIFARLVPKHQHAASRINAYSQRLFRLS